MPRQEDRLESLARELAKRETVEAAMLAAGYAPETARQGRVRHNGRLVSPNNHPVVMDRLANLRAEANREAVVTIHTIVARLDRAYDLAKKRATRLP